jgi:predicted porin
MIKKTPRLFLLSSVAVASMTLMSSAIADDASDTKAQIKNLQQQVDMLKNKVDAQGAAASSSGDSKEILKDMEFYGNLDLSLDSTTKGLKSSYPAGANAPGGSPAGNMSWMPAISSNLSYLGLKGEHSLDGGMAVVFQLETQLDVSATSGTVNTTSNNDSIVKGGLTSRNSFVGLAGDLGKVKIGKTDAPYKTSTARMNPFSGMLGDYQVIMGNTGGDNRVEFGTRIDHAIWYESPVMNGFSVNFLYSPGQNRNIDNAVQAAGESSCTGGNIPSSGTSHCDDGSYGTATSLNVAYEKGPLYVTLAYENHSNVNRQGDNTGTPTNDSQFISDETATKIGVQYRFESKTTVGAIYEDMKRGTSPVDAGVGVNVDERARKGFWLTATQEFTPKDILSVGWAHAYATPGDPGTHNSDATANPDNSANMYTIAYRHFLDKRTSWYTNYATTVNNSGAHYDLGAGGRGVTTDCHDGGDANTMHCYAGGTLQGISVGMNYKF